MFANVSLPQSGQNSDVSEKTTWLFMLWMSIKRRSSLLSLLPLHQKAHFCIGYLRVRV